MEQVTSVSTAAERHQLALIAGAAAHLGLYDATQLVRLRRALARLSAQVAYELDERLAKGERVDERAAAS